MAVHSDRRGRGQLGRCCLGLNSVHGALPAGQGREGHCEGQSKTFSMLLLLKLKYSKRTGERIQDQIYIRESYKSGNL